MNIADEKILVNTEMFSFPFPYFFCDQAFSPKLSSDLLIWLQEKAPWKLVETDFYEQYELSFFDVQLPPEISFLTSKDFLLMVKSNVESLFSVKFDSRIDFTAHKLISGQRIRIHNDYIPNCETHRLLIQFNKGWEDENGGMLMLFNSHDPNDVHKIFRPTHNSSVGFAISPDSHHAVSTIHKGERFTIIYSFYQQVNE